LGVRFHDPGGFPFATLPLDQFLRAWCAERVNYPGTPYVLRSAFARIESRSRAEAIQQALPGIRSSLAADPGGPERFGSLRAIELTAGMLRQAVSPRLSGHLTNFALPLAARRRLDAAGFLREAGNTKADGETRSCRADVDPAGLIDCVLRARTAISWCPRDTLSVIGVVPRSWPSSETIAPGGVLVMVSGAASGDASGGRGRCCAVVATQPAAEPTRTTTPARVSSSVRPGRPRAIVKGRNGTGSVLIRAVWARDEGQSADQPIKNLAKIYKE